jgi:PhoPQ-activated pathogenicity-related protein
MKRLLHSLLLFVLTVPLGFSQSEPLPTELKDYVFKKDDTFKWTLKDKTETDAGTVYTIDMISQTWQGIAWDHGLVVVVPKGAKNSKTMMLWNQGGSPSVTNNTLAVEIAKRVGYPCAFLYGVPKQPLYGGMREDTLIAETFCKYLETGDPSWPLLFPMVKSVVKAMDCIQEFAKKEWKHDQEGFIVTGASKRGWTSWLTAASGDKRVKAIAPMVIDTLNFQKQMPHQFQSFGGKYSEQIIDYEKRKLLPLPETNAAKKLWAMVDPWVYRDAITVPKLIINGTNDPYWAQDALNMYWDDLKGDKHVCYVPNAGHDLRAMETPNVPNSREAKRVDLFPTKAVNALAAFCKYIIEGKEIPKLEWEFKTDEKTASVVVKANTAPKAAKLWINKSDTADFRKSKWEAKDIASLGSNGKPEPLVGSASKTPSGYTAVMAEVAFDCGGLEHTLCTQIKILGPQK